MQDSLQARGHYELRNWIFGAVGCRGAGCGAGYLLRERTVIRKRTHRGGYVSFYAPGRVIHFSPEEYADRVNTARRLRAFRDAK